MSRSSSPGHRLRRAAVLATAAALSLGIVPATASAQTAVDPRQGLQPASNPNSATSTTIVDDAGKAASGVAQLSSQRTPAWTTGITPLNSQNINSDLAFSGKYAFSGNYSGFGVYDMSDPAAPALKAAVTCRGSQNDISVHGDLLFLSVEATNARVDCAAPGAPVTVPGGDTVFRGVRIFDVSNPLAPEYVSGVQTCRGSHTHTVVTKPGVSDKIWIYVSGTAGIRASTQLEGCSSGSSLTDPTTANFRIDVIEVPLAAPASAKVVSNPRIFSKCGSSACEADYAKQEQHPVERYGIRGTLNWLNTTGRQPTYPADDPRASGPGYAAGGQLPLAQSSTCHDITVYPAIGLAAGACAGDGMLLDIKDPVNPVRIDNVTDNNFAYFHSATFNDAGTKVVFTDEWGGGGLATCEASDPTNWGANAIFDIVTKADGSRKLEWRSYYKIPGVQSATENCVAHNGNLVPVPGRDIMVQAWYQGGLSVWDFTDSTRPKEIGFFDRGPVTTTGSQTGGFWSTYLNNGAIVGNEIRLGFDTYDLRSAALTKDQLSAAKAVRTAENNPQHQQRIAYPASFTTVRGFYDSAVQTGALSATEAAEVEKFIDRAEGFNARQKNSAKATLNAKAGELLAPAQQPLADAMRALATSF